MKKSETPDYEKTPFKRLREIYRAGVSWGRTHRAENKGREDVMWAPLTVEGMGKANSKRLEAFDQGWWKGFMEATGD